MFEVCGRRNHRPYIGKTIQVEWMEMSEEERENRLRAIGEEV